MTRCGKDSNKFSFSQLGNTKGSNFKGLGFIVVFFLFIWGGLGRGVSAFVCFVVLFGFF